MIRDVINAKVKRGECENIDVECKRLVSSSWGTNSTATPGSSC